MRHETVYVEKLLEIYFAAPSIGITYSAFGFADGCSPHDGSALGLLI